ncbi:ATP-grasp domain-containing protein [Spongiactinospora gelatinilytica]|uniref:ATP-grasp domain-containing protein n=1 Tax=Spongiactinospora gelatinilytica TaxID=2666298 RepID=UPI0018F7B0F6|nr:ATP-grasp domain-containing protein [Spongiactinospora gelatinilytica]
MTDDNRLLMVQPYSQLVQKAVAAGFTVYSIWDPALQTPEYLRDVAEHSAELLLTDFSDVAELRRLVRETAVARDVAHVLHLGKEQTMLPVAEEAYALGLAPNTPAAIRALNDKAATRELLAGHGLSPVRSVRAGAPGELAPLLTGFDLPVIVKPCGLQGSAGVRLVHAAGELADWAAELAAFGYHGPVLAEEYLRGPEFSVETLSAGGRHQVIGITAKETMPPPLFVETGHVFPAPLPEPDAAAIADLVTAFLDAAGLTFGPAHTEVILTGDGPRIVESQARLGGDRIPSLIRIATGFDIEAAIFEALAGRPVLPGPARATGCVSFFQLPPGPIAAAGGVEQIAALPFVREVKFRFGPGDVLPVTRHSRSRHGYVVTEGPTPEAARDRAAEAKALLWVEPEGTPVNAVRRIAAATPDPARTLLLIGHLTEPIRLAKSLGLNVILIQHKDKFQPEQAELADVTLIADYTDWAVLRPLAEAAHRIWNFSAALSLTEPGLEPAGRINDLFGLGGTGHRAAHLLRDKLAMRRHLAAAGAPTVAAEPLREREDLRAFGDRHGYPFVVKPTDLTAGFGISLVRGPQDAGPVWERVRATRADGVDRGTTLYELKDYLMEEYICGPEYSVETFSFAGRHVVVAITEKLVGSAHFAELGHAMPARVDAGTAAAITAATAEFLDVIGVADGPAHTELRISPRGPLVIESHNRIGGGRIGALVRAAYGIDLTHYTLAWPFGLVSALPGPPEPIGAACARGLVGRPGRIAAVEGVEELRKHPDVLAVDVSARPGAVVRRMRDNWDRLGLVAVAASDTDKAVRLCEELIETVTVRMEGDR